MAPRVALPVVAIAALLLAAGWAPAALAADAEAWKSQIIYFLITDRFAQSPGVTPSAPCDKTGWNNGTWSGITHNLDYIKDLGMTAIWITPIPYQLQGEHFGEYGYHGYWAADWTRLDPHYGTEEDLQELLRVAKHKGVMTMLDVVANHVGPSGQNYSGIVPFDKPEYYHECIPGCDQWCNIPQSAYDSQPMNTKLITTCRLQNLPDLNQSHPFVKEALLTWLDDTLRKFDFDGLRIDTVKHVGVDFWQDYNAVANRFTMGEALNGDTATLTQYLQGPKPAMDSLLNFPMYYALFHAFAEKQDMRQFAAERARQYGLLGREATSLLGNFVDNHDVPRFLTSQPDEALLKNALAWALMAEGIPVIYYGTASGMKGEVARGLNRGCLWESGYSEESDLYQTVRRLAKYRTAHELWNQPEETVSATPNCYVFARGPRTLVVTTNGGSGSSATCSVQLPEGSELIAGGVAGLRDVLRTPWLSHDAGLVWYPATRTLTVRLPDGAPRVLSAVPAQLEGGKASGGAPSQPEAVSSAARGTSAPRAGALLAALAAVAAALAL